MQTLTNLLITFLVSSLASNIRIQYLSKFVLVTSFLVFQSANAAGYLYHYGGEDYDSLGEAESVMRSSGTPGSDRLVRYETIEDPNTGKITYRYNVPSFPMVEIAPEFFSQERLVMALMIYALQKEAQNKLILMHST